MKYRELLNSLSNEEFAQVVAEDGIFNTACVENLNEQNECGYSRVDCYKCILALLNSEVENGDILKRDMQD